jgi:hypothetical protein
MRQRDSPFWRSDHESSHLLRLDSCQCLFGFLARRIAPDPHPEPRAIRIDSRLIATLGEAQSELVRFCFGLERRYLY